MTRGEKIFWGLFAAIVLVVLCGALAWRAMHPVVSSQTTIGALLADPTGLPGLLTGTPPWENNTGTLADRMDAIGFPKMSMEGAVLHIHQHLDIFVHGKQIVIPANIGINGFFSPIHVHDTSGIVHVESPVAADFYLGQFFDVWGVRLTKDCMGGLCVDSSNSLRIYVNGTLYAGDPRSLKLDRYQEIAIVYGTDAETPDVIPSIYGFPQGY